MFSCKNEIKTNVVSENVSEIAFNSFFDLDTIPEILQLDSLYNSEFEKWSEFLSLSEILNDMSKEDGNHRILISSLYNQLENVETDKIPAPFDTPPIIGRTKVLKTFVEKIFLSDETEFNSDGYRDDIKKIIISFNALVYQLNVRVKEINF
ncbi:MAG: hypothetical protein VYD56_03480 [Bacteroidota bacterium]|nr:hypothetical protein [Bacteroidota bacterium]